MKSISVVDLYKKYYSDIQFERAGLFRLLQRHYRCIEVLYPGSFIHITPSFFFPHVVYIDKNSVAAEFFQDTGSVLRLVNRNKEYKRSAYIRFLREDYSKITRLEDARFDLLISLYAGNIPRVCKRYLKPGGLLLINYFQDDLVEAGHDPEYNLVGAVRYRRQKYELEQESPGTFLRDVKKADNGPHLKQTSLGMVFVERGIYFLFKKV